MYSTTRLIGRTISRCTAKNKSAPVATEMASEI